MKTKRTLLFFLLVLGAIILSACSRGPISTNWAGLAADAEHAYISNGSFIYAVDMTDGKEVWRYPTEADSKLSFYANPILTEDGQLLIGSAGTSHPFLSLNPKNGKENWTESFLGAKGAWMAPPLVFDGQIYAPNTDGYLYTLDMEGKQAADPIELGGALWSTPATDGNLIYVTSLDHHLHIINPAGSAVIEPIDLGGAAPSSAAIGTDGAYIGSFASTIEFVQPNGSHKAIATAENWIWGAPVLDGETLYYADLNGNIYSLDLATSNQNWSAIKPDGPVVASPLVAGNQVYVATESGSFYALDREGKTVWEKVIGGKIYTTPVAAADLILVAPYQADFILAAYDAAGKQAWTFTPAK